MVKQAHKRDLDFLYEIGTLNNMDRGWKQHLGMNCANVLGHSMRVAFLALVIARKEGVENEEKILKMALVHDITETRTSDLSYVQKVYVKEDDANAAKDMFAGTIFGDIFSEYWNEYEKRESIEAKIVKDADNLDIDLELRELAMRGSRHPAIWTQNRKMVRDEKLYTDAARELWDEIQNSDTEDWHMIANKWHHIPDAGK